RRWISLRSITFSMPCVPASATELGLWPDAEPIPTTYGLDGRSGVGVSANSSPRCTAGRCCIASAWTDRRAHRGGSLKTSAAVCKERRAKRARGSAFRSDVHQVSGYPPRLD
ncbi:hypothetical protein B0H13DRAFT_2056021, partial [Mycena leptocephala]